MLITRLEVQKKNAGRVNVYIDGNFAFGASTDSVLKYHLKEGLELSENQLEHIKIDGERELCIARATKYLARALKTEKEVKNYLISKGFDDQTVDFAMQKLKQYDFVDDEKFAKNYAKFKSIKQGRRKTAFELKRKGIVVEKFENLIFSQTNDRQTACNLLEKYLKNKPLDIKTKQKAYRFLASRGFSGEDSAFALSKFFDGED